MFFNITFLSLPTLNNKGAKAGEEVSRKGAKTQSELVFLTAFFASLRLGARNILPTEHAHRFEYFLCKAFVTHKAKINYLSLS